MRRLYQWCLIALAQWITARTQRRCRHVWRPAQTTVKGYTKPAIWCGKCDLLRVLTPAEFSAHFGEKYACRIKRWE